MTYVSVTKSSTPYEYKGTKNNSSIPHIVNPFINICKMPQKKLKRALVGALKDYGYETIVGDGYIYARGYETEQGKCPVLLTAHMDTVHSECVKDWYEDVVTDENGSIKHIITSPQGIGGDDRCGIFMILEILDYTVHRPSILFCEDEEIGGVGSRKFCKTQYIDELRELKYLIELDRANANDLVFYNDDNYDFVKFCEKVTEYKEAFGSFSDISNLAPACNVSAVNISCGYYHAHTVQEEVVIEEMVNSMEATRKLLEEAYKEDTEAYKYIEYKRTYSGYGSYYSNRYSWDDYYDDYYLRYGNGNDNTSIVSSPYKSEKEKKEKDLDAPIEMYVVYLTMDDDGSEKECEYFVSAESKMSCFGKFFKENPDICYNDVLDYEFY